jgi:hypothetical protein
MIAIVDSCQNRKKKIKNPGARFGSQINMKIRVEFGIRIFG